MCNQCIINPVYEFTNKRTLCKTCFVRWFEKKFFYTLRKFSLVTKSDKIKTSNSKDIRNVVLKELIKIYNSKVPKKSEKTTLKIANFQTTDSIAYSITKDLFKNKLSNKYLPKLKNKINPLYLFLDKEILLYANLKKLKFSNKKQKNTKLPQLVNKLEEKHPEIKHAIIQSYLKLY